MPKGQGKQACRRLEDRIDSCWDSRTIRGLACLVAISAWRRYGSTWHYECKTSPGHAYAADRIRVGYFEGHCILIRDGHTYWDLPRL